MDQVDTCTQLIKDLLGAERVQRAGRYGGVLECTMYPINAILHPSRLYTLLQNYKKGNVLPENPLFYEDMTAEATQVMDELNGELIAVAQALSDQGVAVGDVPHIFDWLAVYVYDEPKTSNLQHFFQTNKAYQGFRCPLIPHGDGFVPDFTNRYFTEDINLGLCGYKGLAELAQVETPLMDTIILWAQTHMGVEFLTKNEDGQLRLKGKDLSQTNVPQRFGFRSIDDLRQLYPKQS